MENPYSVTIKAPSDLTKSQRAFCRALSKAIVGGQDASKISVSEMCELSELSRTTFYNNYTSVEEVLSDVEDIAIEAFGKKFAPFLETEFTEENIEKAVYNYIVCVTDEEVIPLLRFLILQKSPSFYDKWTKVLHQRLYPFFKNIPNYEVPLGVYANVIQYGIHTYLSNPGKYTAKQAAGSISTLYKTFKAIAH